jgi:hypothetical protein
MNYLKNLPLPIKVLGGTITLGGLLVSIRMVPARAIWIIVVGMLVAMLLVGLYMLIQALMSKRRAASMGGQLTQHSAVTPRGLSDPAQRAKLDNLRQTFGKGIERFRAAGKDLYSLPWYMVVGEPGAGKSEAIRHCNVGFPPGLQDELQGAGGTINMHWWFMNPAVILDTAGRLMFEEVAPGSTSEWREFLVLLRRTRPTCPINGLILVVPADSLIKDTADDIGKKASRIAQQLSTIQAALDVRFPVFVLITKTDLINGFREFFENLKDPRLQHQMLGWSNPDQLDQPFRPELIDRHLEQVATRIRRRRLGLLSDPTPQSEFADGRRLDEVDALFALPASFELLAPRMRRYLEMIFMPNEWSGKPLFLRGIYFTSAMREGSALDQELAEAIGVSVDSLPEGKTWERERAYFLRDLFMEKIFREKGLVTRASNTRKMLRRRQAILLGGVAACILALGIVAWVGRKSVQESVGRERDFWTVAGEGWQEGVWRPILAPEFKNSPDFLYNGSQEIAVGEEKLKLTEYHRRLAELVEADIQVPWVFTLMSNLVSGTNADRRKAQRIVFEGGVVKPMLDAGRVKIENAGENWTDRGSRALALLVHLEGMIYHRGEGLTADDLAPETFFEPLGDLLYGDPKPDPSLRKTFEWTYLKGGDGRGKWPPAWMSAGFGLRENRPIASGLKAFLAYTEASQSEQEAGIAHIKGVRAELVSVRQAEEALFRVATNPGSTSDALRAALDTFLRQKSQFDLSMTKAVQSNLFDAGTIVLRTSYGKLVEQSRKRAKDAFVLLQAEIDRFAGSSNDKGDVPFTLGADLAQQIKKAQAQTQARTEGSFSAEELTELQELDRLFLEKTAAGDPLVNVRSALYQLARSQMDDPGAGETLIGTLQKRVEGLSGAIARAKEETARYQGSYSQELNQIMRRLLELSQTRGLESLFVRYGTEFDAALKQGVGFPLLRDSTRIMKQEELGTLDELLRKARADLPFIPDGPAATLIRKRVQALSSLAEALVADGGRPATVTLTLLKGADQDEKIKRQLGAESLTSAFIGSVWRALRLNGGLRVNTINRDNVELGKVSVAAPSLKIEFYQYSDSPEAGRTVSYDIEWAALQLLLQSSSTRLPGGRDWDVFITQKDDQGRDRYLVLRLQFEKTLPEPDQWPSRTGLGL